ncbi:MAG: hypothetical protein HY815_01540 [Candidatus Riflebacteria bacterium]|nr:hypothetical protein [Candidatus Riflebacteria bacterium]
MHRVLIGVGFVLALLGVHGTTLLALKVPIKGPRDVQVVPRDLEIQSHQRKVQPPPGANRDNEPGRRAPFQYDVTPVDEDEDDDRRQSRPDLIEIRGA